MTNGRLKHGDIRETDGFVFWSYHPGVKTGEVWLSHERFMARKESAKANAKKRYHADIEKSRANLRDWHHANKEKKHAAFKRWSDANKARRAEWMDQWVKKNRDKIAAWRSTPKAMARNRKNSAMRRAAARSVLISDAFEVGFLYDLCQTISRATGIPHDVDHIIPLCRGGAHASHNLRIIPERANCVKGGRLEGQIQQYQFQITQAQNAQIGRIGTAPAQMGQANTQTVNQ